MNVEQQKTKGNARFRRKVPPVPPRLPPPLPPLLPVLLTAAFITSHTSLLHLLPQEYADAVEHYSAALRLLDGSSGAADTAPLHLALLTNRSLALHRLGRYAAAAADAEGALQLEPSSSKAAFRAAAARLIAGDGATAMQHARLLVCDGSTGAEGASSAAASQLAVWAALAQHATAMAEHQQRLAAAESSTSANPDIWELLQALAAEAEGEGEAAGGPAALLHRLAALLGAGGRQGESGASAGIGSHSSHSSDATKAAVALEAHPQGFRLLLFFLADPDPAAQQAAAAALQAAAHAAAGGRAGTVLWPSQVWQRLAALATDTSGGEVQRAALRLLSWASGQDTWVREQLLLHPLHTASSSPQASAATHGRPAVVEQVAGLLLQAATLHRMGPAAVQAAAELLRQYATDAAAAEALAQLGCQPLLALVRAASLAEGMAAFLTAQQNEGAEDPTVSAAERYAPGGDGSSSSKVGGGSGDSSVDPEQEALEALRDKLRKVFIADLVAFQRCLLAAACQLASASRELLLGEAVVEQGSGSGGVGGKRGVGAGPFLTGVEGRCLLAGGWQSGCAGGLASSRRFAPDCTMRRATVTALIQTAACSLATPALFRAAEPCSGAAWPAAAAHRPSAGPGRQPKGVRQAQVRSSMCRMAESTGGRMKDRMPYRHYSSSC